MRTRSVGLVMLIVLATITAGLVTVVALRAGEALPGTRVSGLDVGGLTREQVQERLAGTVQARTTGQLELVHEDLRVPLDRAALGVRVDLDRTADRALDAGRTGSPWAPLLGPLLGRGEPVELAVDVDGAVLGQQVDDLAAQVDSPAFGGDLLIEGTTVTPQPPAPGRTLDREQARLAVRDALASGRTEPLPLPVEVQDPGTTADDVELVAQQAREALAAPYRLVGPQAALEVTPVELAPLLEVAYADRSLSLRVQDEAFRALVVPRADALDRPPTPAGFEVVSGQPTVDTQGDLTWSPQPAQVDVRPSTPGLDVDAEQSVQRLRELVGTPEREGELPAGEAPATLTTERAQQAGVDSLLGTFTTYFSAGQNRASNIRRIASVLDGTYVAPGDLLSLNGVAGPRTRAKGYLADGAIIRGELEDVVGGGVSQFATTLFNAAFFAGLPIEEHQPHSFYISRYPAGRESTVNFGSIDVKVRNDTANGFLVKTSSTARSVTVAIYGNNGGRTVTSTTGPRVGRSGGGFTINVTRTITGGDGKGGTRVFRTVYNPPPDD